MSDPRVYKLDHFISGQHSKPGPALAPSLNQLPKPYNVCIVGASRGIGAGVAKSYAKAGCTALVLASRDMAALKSVAEDVHALSPSTTVHLRIVDITSAESVRVLSTFVSQSLDGGKLDVVVLNSGYAGTVQVKVTDSSPEDGEWAQAFDVNVLGTYHVAHYFVPLLLEGKTKAFVVVGSIASAITKGIIANSKYCISKMAQVRIVEHLAAQFHSEGLLAVAVHPGAVDSKMGAESSMPEEFKKYLVDDPELCGAFCVWVTRDAANFQWLNGRLVSANWDPEELLSKKDDIISGDLLKFEARTTFDSV